MPGYGDIGIYGDSDYKQDGMSGDGEAEFLVQNKINAYSGKCIRYAVRPDQGQGYSFYKNRNVPEAWIWPDPQSDPLCVFDNKGQPRYIILDEVTGKWYEIGTRIGPTGTDVEEVYVDKQDGEYVGTEIPCALKLREHTADREHKKIEHNETHIGIRPQREENKGLEGYGVNGLRDGFAMSIEAYKNGNLSEDAIAVDVPLDGDVVFDRSIEDRRIQIGVLTDASEFRLTYLDQYYVQKDSAESRKEMSEHLFQAEFAEPLLWLTRGENMNIDQATGDAMDGDYSETSQGPEGK